MLYIIQNELLVKTFHLGKTLKSIQNGGRKRNDFGSLWYNRVYFESFEQN